MIDAGNPPFERTKCCCERCIVGCRTMPGSLAPGDIERILHYVSPPDPWKFVEENFLASDGFKILANTPDGVKTLAVPTIVPAKDDDGRCVFLSPGDRCIIHPVSPFGCAYYDTHMVYEEAENRSLFSVAAVVDDSHATAVSYRVYIAALREQGKIATPASERRAAMEAELQRLAVDEEQQNESGEDAVGGVEQNPSTE